MTPLNKIEPLLPKAAAELDYIQGTQLYFEDNVNPHMTVDLCECDPTARNKALACLAEIQQRITDLAEIISVTNRFLDDGGDVRDFIKCYEATFIQ